MTRIFDPHGSLVRMVTGPLALHSGDPAFREIGESVLREIREWTGDIEERLQRVLEGRGYRVERSGESRNKLKKENCG